MLNRSLFVPFFLLGALAPGALALPLEETDSGAPILTALREGGLELEAPAWSRALLLVGEWDEAGEVAGRRVDPLRTAWLDVGPLGKVLLPAERPDVPLFAQAWLPPAAGATSPAGSWSRTIVLLPQDPSSRSAVQTGDIVITEFMKDPSAVTDSHGEWIEIRNNLKWRCDINGMILSDASGASYVFSAPFPGICLKPYRHYVLGIDDDPATNGGVQVDYSYSGFSLKNSSDEIYLHTSSGVLLDAVVYDDGVLWPDSPGMSISLDPSITDPVVADDPSLWCHSSSTFGGGDTGTPKAPNDVCP